MTGENNSDNLIGKIVGQYTILEEIGRGGMATVYSARQKSMNRVVALKVLPYHFLHDPGFLERFEREVEVISHLEHPHILPIYDYGEVDNVPFIAMRFLGGGSMAQMIRRGIPDLHELDRPFSQICQALDYAHKQGIVHRDLKPGNIMLDENGNAYLSDFGIARVMGSNLTGSAIIGTPAYMSPEQANGLTIDARSDIYALGVVLFELITGREPYQAETPMALLLKHINEPMPAIRNFRSDVPYQIEDLIIKATEKDPDDRFSSAGEMARAFSQALREVHEEDETRSAVKTRPVEPEELPTRKSTPQPTPPVTVPLEQQVKDMVAEQLSQSGVHGQARTQGSTSLGRWVAGIVVIVVLGVAAVLASGVLNPPASVVNTASLIPTPFRTSETIQHLKYTISIPQSWIPQVTDFNDESTEDRFYHVWRDDSTAYAALGIVEASRTIETYDQLYFSSQEGFTFVSTEAAPDGTTRRSYRVSDHPTLANGQVDVFYRFSNGNLIALELYTADSVAAQSAMIDTLQLILDSLRVPPPRQTS